MSNKPRERGQILRRAIKQAIQEDRVAFEESRPNRWRAVLEYMYDKEVPCVTPDGKDGVVIQTYLSYFTVWFTPDVLEYGRCPVYESTHHYYVDWRTYRWAVRKLSEYQVMQKMSE